MNTFAQLISNNIKKLDTYVGKWDTHGEKWDVMSQFSPYMSLRIVSVLPIYTLFTYSKIKIVNNIELIDIHEEGSKDAPNTVNVTYYTYSTSFTHLHKGGKTSFYTQNFSFVTLLTKMSAIWLWRDMEWRQLRATEKCFLEADLLKTTDVISVVPVLPCPSSPYISTTYTH